MPAGRLAKLGPALRIVYSAERYRDGVLYERAEVTALKANDKLPETLFTLP